MRREEVKCTNLAAAKRLSKATAPGNELVYHVGHLAWARARERHSDEVAEYFYKLAEAGEGHLVQRRNHEGGCVYIWVAG